jgi:hypothetical protein
MSGATPCVIAARASFGFEVMSTIDASSMLSSTKIECDPLSLHVRVGDHHDSGASAQREEHVVEPLVAET